MKITTNVKVTKKPTILIKLDVMKQIQALITLVNNEVGFMGIVDYNKKENEFILTAIHIPIQTITSVTVDIEEEGMDELTNDLLNKGEEGVNAFSNMYLWGHSHVNMAVSPSLTDIDTMKVTMGKRPKSLMLIINKSNEIRCDLWLNDNILGKIIIEDLTVTYEIEENPFNSMMKKIIKDKLKKPVFSQNLIKLCNDIKTVVTIDNKPAYYNYYGVMYKEIYYTYDSQTIPAILIEKMPKSIQVTLDNRLEIEAAPLGSQSKEALASYKELTKVDKNLFPRGVLDYEEFHEGGDITNKRYHWNIYENSPILQNNYTFFADYIKAILLGDVQEGPFEDHIGFK